MAVRDVTKQNGICFSKMRSFKKFKQVSTFGHGRRGGGNYPYTHMVQINNNKVIKSLTRAIGRFLRFPFRMLEKYSDRILYMSYLTMT